MNWEQIEGQWLQFTGNVKSRWGKLTSDDLIQVAGKRDQLAGRIQERYGILKDDAEEQVDLWLSKAKPASSDKFSTSAK